MKASEVAARLIWLEAQHGDFEVLIDAGGCNVCAVNSIIAELRANGFTVACDPVKGQRGVYPYTLNEQAQMPLFGV